MQRARWRRGTRSTLLRCATLSLVLVGSGCVGAAPSGETQAVDREHQQALDALARWEAAVVERGGAHEFVPVGELTRQVGDWEFAVGENNKMALMAGMIEPQVEIPEDTGTGEVVWADGTTTAVEVVSAKDALVDVRRVADSSCAECTPLMVSAARLATSRIETSRGSATVPTWEFAIAGSAVLVTRVAVANAIVLSPAGTAEHAPVGLSIESATVSADGRRLTVSFVGAPRPGSEPCGADYTGEAVESELAVAVIVMSHENPAGGSCTLVGAMRTATADLSAPLHGRVVLESLAGRPVAVATGR